MTTPVVTVVVPCFQNSRWIPGCLESVRTHADVPFEIVIVDDASSDGSAGVAEAWLAAHPDVDGRVVRRACNGGICAALNDGVASGRGEFVTIVAADDELTHRGLSVRVAALRAHPEKLAVFADAVAIDEAGATVHQSAIDGLYGPTVRVSRDDYADPARLVAALVMTWAVPGPVFLCRRDAYRTLGGYNEQLRVEDWDFYLRVAERGALMYLDVVVARYRVHPGSMSATRARAMSDDQARTAAAHVRAHRGLPRAYLAATALSGASTPLLVRRPARLVVRALRAEYLRRRRTHTPRPSDAAAPA